MGLENDSPTTGSVASGFELLDSPPGPSAQVTLHEVAIIGMSCRTAGNVDTPDKLWDFLLQRKYACGTIPAQRWEPWRNRGSRHAKVVDETINKGYFLDRLEHFDAAFFGISPAEAELMDPQQRLGLELAWEALENAGIRPDLLSGSDTGVFMGVDSNDYSLMLMGDLPTIEPWSGIGPSTAVDAACASSLVAIHLARQSISNGESTLAICGGVNVICAPALSCTLQKAGALSADGVCRSFDDAANGYGRGEGGAVIVLKRLEAAIEDNDNILAVLKGSASAQDGKTNGIMAPSSLAQERVARLALSCAGAIDPRTIDYIEAHATSTSRGDPTEIAALARVYGTDRSSHSPCYLGSLKPNIGHLEAAAGAVGILKTVLSLQTGVIAPQTLLKDLNSRIDWANSGLSVVKDSTAWPERDVRRAAVCSYGYGGSVCHAILEQAPKPKGRAAKCQRSDHIVGDAPVILTLSAHKRKRLSELADNLARWLSDSGTRDILAVARTLSQRRAMLSHRVSFVVADTEDARRALTDFADGKVKKWTTSGCKLESASQKGAVWVFSGHGAQWPDMGRELLLNPVFHDALSNLDDVFLEEAGFSVVEALRTSEIGGSARVQVLTYAVQIGLTAQLLSQGVAPRAVIGHSVGEIAAAVTAGCITQREGARIVSRRAKLYEQVEGQGTMSLVTLPFEQVAQELSGRDDIAAAIRSSPTTCVVSGTVGAVEQYLQSLKTRGISTTKIKTDIGFHSPLLKHLAPQFEYSLRGDLDPQPAKLQLYSTSTEHPSDVSLRDSRYWEKNMLDPVFLVDAVEAALDDGFQIYMEVSTHPIVSHSISETLTARSSEEFVVFGVMERNTSAWYSISAAISQLHNSGDRVDFGATLGAGPWATTLPNTPWEHKPYWRTVGNRSGLSSRQHDVDAHTVLGGLVQIAGTSTKVWTTTLDVTTKPYPLTHLLGDTEILPAAVYCATFRDATGAAALSNIKMRVPTPITADEREVQIIVDGDHVRIASRLKARNGTKEPDGGNVWTEHGGAYVALTDLPFQQHTFSISALKNRIGSLLPINFVSEYLRSIGASGIAFPWMVTEHFGNEKEMLVRMDMCPSMKTLPWDSKSWAPFLDAATSVGSSIFFKNVRMRIVSGTDQVRFLSKEIPPKEGYLFIENRSECEKLKADISVLSDAGEILLKVTGMQFSDVEAVGTERQGVDALVHRLAWVPPMLSETALAVRNVVVVSENPAMDGYMESLHQLTDEVVRVRSFDSLDAPHVRSILSKDHSVVVYVPANVKEMEDVASSAHAFIWQTVSILSVLGDITSAPKLFIVTQAAHKGSSPTCLAQYPLQGFARVAAAEYPSNWGGLIDNEGPALPLLAIKYVKGQSVIRIQDEVPRVARLRSFVKDELRAPKATDLLPKPHGTYVVTGGFGALGLEVLRFLVQKGARRIVIVSRRAFPPREKWSDPPTSLAAAVKTITHLESFGATFHTVALDMGSLSAPAELCAALSHLSLPPVAGVVHAAGVSGYGYIQRTPSSTYASVMSPKVQGALNLHNAFPCGKLDFFVLFSSIGQLIGTPGQSAYAASNAFLDCLATHRRSQGCNTIAIQWSAWRALGLAADTALVDLELRSSGVADITVQEGLDAWSYLSNIETDHGIVARIPPLHADESLPSEFVRDVVQRRSTLVTKTASASVVTKTPVTEEEINAQVKRSIAMVLGSEAEQIEDSDFFSRLGFDSISTVRLVKRLQETTNIRITPTITWQYPTVKDLTKWIYSEASMKGEVEATKQSVNAPL
ncbi:putative PKS-like protein biosynthetic cluster [Didymella keratinophila]|nr:putative PKS-like protein biosynthetic cluster [Didymella keratinophila]